MTPFKELPYQAYTIIRSHIATRIVLLHLLGVGAAWSQRPGVSFGPITDYPLEFIPVDVAYGSEAQHQQGTLAVLDATHVVHFFKLKVPGILTSAGRLALSQAPRKILLVDYDGNGSDEVLVLSKDGFTFYFHKMKERGYETTTTTLQQEATGFILADYNNNKRKDILLFGRTMSGVAVLTGGTGGRVDRGPLLFSDISVSDLRVTDLNGDGIADVVLLNWLSDEMATFYGIGRGIFSEQLSVKVPGEPTQLALSAVSKQRTYLAAVSVANLSVVLFEGNSLGELKERMTFGVRDSVRDMAFRTINEDVYPDFLLYTKSEVGVWLGTSNTSMGPPTWFGPGSSLAGWAFADVDGDRKQDLILIDKERRRLIALGNAANPSTLAWPNSYAVGNTPSGLSLRDFSGNGLVDIAVANAVSSSISFLFNAGNGRFEGQRNIQISEKPVYLRAVGTPESRSRTIVASHSVVDRLTVMQQTDDNPVTELFTVPTGSNPYVLLVKNDSLDQRLEMLVRYTDARENTPSLSLFEQLSGRHFVERSLRATLPKRIAALTLDDERQNDQYHLLYAVHSPSAGRTSVNRAYLTPEFNFTASTELFSFPDLSSATQGLMISNIDRDQFKDILVLKGPPQPGIAIAYGTGGGGFRDSLEWLWGFNPANDDVIIIRDLDGDGRNDLVFLDADRNAVVALYQKQPRRFRPSEIVVDVPDARSIRVASLRLPKVYDLVLSRSERGSVEIFFDPFR